MAKGGDGGLEGATQEISGSKIWGKARTWNYVSDIKKEHIYLPALFVCLSAVLR
jgi:hypothetical protein